MSHRGAFISTSPWQLDSQVRPKGEDSFLGHASSDIGERLQVALAHPNAVLIFSKIQGACEWIQSGVQNEVTRAYSYFSKSEHVQTLYGVFQKAVTYLPFQETVTEAAPEEETLRGAALLKAEVSEPEASIALDEEPLPLTDPTELRGLSKLKKNAEDVADPVKRKVVSSLYGRVSRENGSAFREVIAYVGSFLGKKLERSPLSPHVREAFSSAIEREEGVKEFIEQQKGQYVRQPMLLRQLARTFSEEVEQLEEGRPYIYFGRMSEAGAPKVPPFFDAFLKEQLPPQVYEFLQSDSSDLVEKVKAHILRNLEEEGLISEESGEAYRKVCSALNRVMERASGMAQKLSPRFYEMLSASLSEDLRELAVGPRSEGETQRVAEEMWDRMVEQGFENALEETVSSVLAQSKGFIQDHINEVVGDVTSKMPKAMLQCLSASGFHLHEGEHFWMEIEKQANGKYTLRLYSNDFGGDFHGAVTVGEKQGYHLPLVYSDIEPEKLDREFFLRLISYQAWPEWKQGVTYSLRDLHEGLLASLGKKAADPVAATVFPESMPLTDRLADWLQLYLNHHLDLTEPEFARLFRYDLPLEMLVNYWPEVHKNPDVLKQYSVRAELQRMVDQLSEEGVKLYRQQKITLAELRELYGTVWEVQDAIQNATQSQDQTTYVPSMVVPPQMQGFIKEMLMQSGVTPTHIEALKEVFMALLGEEFEETFDLIIQEVIPQVAKERGITEPQELTWSEVFGIENVKKYVHQVRTMRPSLLHIYRAYAQASSVISHILGFSIAAKMIEAFLVRFFPQINSYSYLSTKRLAQLLAYFGPGILEKVLPRDVYAVFKAFFGLYKEIFSYIRRRIALTVLRSVMHHVLGQEEVDSLNQAAKMLQQQLTREGEITFGLPQVKPLGKRFVVQLSQGREQQVTVEEPKEEAEIEPVQTFFKHPAEMPRPQSVKVDVNRVGTILPVWYRSVDMIARDNGFGRSISEREKQAALYLNAQLRDLPIPGQKGGEIWEQHENPQELLEHMHMLLYRLHKYTAGSVSIHESGERITSLYTLYVIIDTLARRCPTAHIPEDLKANGTILAYWMGGPANRFINRRTYERFTELAAYFGFDSRKSYTPAELESYETGCLFNFDSNGAHPFSPGLVSSENSHISHRGAAHSKSSAYYRSLLEDERVQRRLALHGVTRETPFLEKMTLLFRDPSLHQALEDMRDRQRGEEDVLNSSDLSARAKEEQARLTRSMKATAESGMDQRHGILPRPFYILRLTHLMVQEIACASAEQWSSPSRFHNSDPDVQGLVIEAPVRKALTDCLLARVYNYTKTKFHQVTFSFFRDQQLVSNLTLFPGKCESRTKDLDFSRRLLAIGATVGIGANLEQGLWEGRLVEEELIHKPSERSQSEIMIKGALELGEVLPEEARILEMINTYRSDQVIRCLSFFSHSRDRLTDPRFRSLFDIFVNNIPALEAQLEERPAITEDIGRYFAEMLKHFRDKKDWATCLYLTKVGNEMLAHCERYNEQARDHFPDFANFIQSEAAPYYRKKGLDQREMGRMKDGLIVSYCYLVSSFLHLDPNQLSGAKKRHVMQAIARLAYTQNPWPWHARTEDVMRKSQDVIYLWEPHLKAAMEEDAEFREEVLAGLVEDLGLDPQIEMEPWTGEFPVYQKGVFSVDLDFKAKHAGSRQHYNVIQKVCDLTSIMPCDAMRTVGETIFFGGTDFFAVKKGEDLEIFRSFNGKRHRFLNPSEWDTDAVKLEQGEALWMEVGKVPPTILRVKRKEIIERYVLECDSEENHYQVVARERYVDGTFINEADLTGCEHGLSLLSWFQPSCDVRTLTDCTEAGNVLKRIEFPKVDLAYDLQEVDGERRAVDMSGRAPGYFIAKRQRDTHLTPYSQYLLLENAKGEKKVHIVAHSFQELLGLYFLKNIGQISLSPLAESGIKGLLTEVDQEKEQQVYTFSLNDQGELESSDPKALAYLAFFHMAQGNEKECFRYFQQLQDLGRRYPFPPEVFAALDHFLIPLIVGQTPGAEKLLLQIVALREENSLVHQQAQLKESPLDHLRWLAVQIKYYSYLESIKRGGHAYLSHYDELFLLKAVGRHNRKVFEQQYKEAIGSDATLGWIKMIGVDAMADHLLMAPRIAERYHFLRQQHGEGSVWNERAEALLLNGIFGEAPQLNVVPGNVIPDIDQLGSSPEFTRRRNLFSRILSTYKRTVSHPFARHRDHWNRFHFLHHILSRHGNEVAHVSTNLEDLTPSYLKYHLLTFYRLAAKALPEDWKGDREKETLFAKKVEAFHKVLPLLQGDISGPWESLTLAVLRTVASGGVSLKALPSPDKLEKELEEAHEYGRLEKEEQRLWKEIQEKGIARHSLKRKPKKEVVQPRPPVLGGVGMGVMQAFDLSGMDFSIDLPEFGALSVPVASASVVRDMPAEHTEHDLLEREWTEEEIEQLDTVKGYVLPESCRALKEEYESVSLKRKGMVERKTVTTRISEGVTHTSEMVTTPQDRFDASLRSLFDRSRYLAVKNSLTGYVQINSLTALQEATKQGLRATTVVARRWFNAASGLNVLLYAQMLMNLVFRLGAGLWHTVQNESIAQRERVEREQRAIVRNDVPLPRTLLEGMSQRETAITRVFKGLLGDYFDVEETPPPEEPEHRAAAYTADPEDEAAVATGFAKLSKSLEDYYARPRGASKKYRLKAGKKAEDLGRDLAQLRDHVSQRLEEERQYIEDYANHKFSRVETEEESVLNRFAHRKAERRRLSFEEIDNAFIKENDRALLGQTLMTEGHLPHLKERLYLFHVMASRWNLLFERIQGLSEPTESALQIVGTELDRTRVYTFDGASERLVRGKLVFESRTCKMLWLKQSEQIDRLLLSRFYRKVVELIMGSGKTWYGIPMSDFFGADGNGLVINIWPAPVAGTNISTIGRQARMIYSQVANALNITRGLQWTVDKLWGIKRVFERTRLQREQMNMTKESLQALELCFIEQGLDMEHMFEAAEGTTAWKQGSDFFRQTLGLVRRKGKGHVDEAHVNFSRSKELNHPVGKSRRLKKPYVEVTEEVLFQLTASPEFRDVLTVKSKKPSPLPQEEFKAKILPLLAQKMACWSDLGIKESEREAFIQYISGEADRIPPFVVRSQKRSEIALVKGLLTVLLPSALEKTIHVDFNPSKEGNGEYARPSEGNDNPIEKSTIRSPFEALVKSGLLLAHDRLKPEQLDRLIRFLKHRAKVIANKQNCDIEATVEARFFAVHCPGYQLSTFEESDRAEVHRLLNLSDRVVYAYLSHFVAKQIRYFGLNLSSNSTNFGSMFDEILGDTGTPFNDETYPKGTIILSDPGTDGESIDVMELPEKCRVEVLEKEAPEEVLDEVIERYFETDPLVSAFIDRGAIVNGMSSERVARRFLAYITEKCPDIDGIAFFLDRELVVLEKGASKPIPIDQSTIPKERLRTFFPQPQTYAADNPQPDGGVGIVSIGEDLCFNELAQAIWRMRGLKRSNQKLIFVMTKRVAKMVAGDRVPTIRDIVRFAQRNESKKLAEDNFQADRQKLNNVIRRAVLDKVLFAPDIDKAIEILRAFKDVFISAVEDDPFFLFGFVDKLAKPEEIFAILRKNLYKVIQDSPYFTAQEKREIREDLAAIGGGNYPEWVHTYEVEGVMDAGRLDDLGKSSQVEESGNEDINRDEEMDIDLNQNLHQNLHQNEDTGERPRAVQTFCPWAKSLNPVNLDWLEVSEAPSLRDASVVSKGIRYLWSFVSSPKPGDKGAPPIFTLRDVLSKTGREESESISVKVPSNILVSNNVAHMIARTGYPVEPFGRDQIPLFEALVIKEGSEEPRLLLVDQKEAAYWREKLEEDRSGKHERDRSVKIGIYDISTRIVGAEGHHRFSPEDLDSFGFNRAVSVIKFLRGDVQFSESQRTILKPWLKSRLESMVRYSEFVREHHAKHAFEGSDLEGLIIELETREHDFALRV